MSELKRYDLINTVRQGEPWREMVRDDEVGEYVLFCDVANLERERDEAVKWNSAVAVCKDHAADIVDFDGGRCVVCERDEALASLKNLREAQVTHECAGCNEYAKQRDEAQRDLAAARAEIARTNALLDAAKEVRESDKSEIARLKADCDHRDEGIAAWRERFRVAEAEIEWLKAEAREEELACDLRRAADMRGCEMWRAANPDKPLTLPSHDGLVVFLITEIERLRPLCDGMAAQIRELCDALDKHNDAIVDEAMGKVEHGGLRVAQAEAKGE